MDQERSLTVKQYITDSGNRPGEEWLKRIEDTGAQAKLTALHKLLETQGSLVWTKFPNFFAPLGDELYEIRLYYRGIWYRLIYFYGHKEAVICHGFMKKTNKTPPKELEIAIERMRIYKTRAERRKALKNTEAVGAGDAEKTRGKTEKRK
jgi:phage-related protein